MKAGQWMKTCGVVCAVCLAAGAPGWAAEAIPNADDWTPRIDKVFFAQQHVQEPTDPLFRMVGNLPALVKVQVYSDEPRNSPEVFAVLSLGDRSYEFALKGPAQLPKPYTGEPKLMPQRYDDSFTGMIPREWVRPGLKVAIELRKHRYGDRQNPVGNTGVTVFDRKAFDNLRVGAGNKVLMTAFDVHFFQEEKGVDFPKGWEVALADKLPVAEFRVQRVRPVVFEQVVMQPSGKVPPIRCRSMAEWEKRAGKRFDGESAAARPWMRALKRAGGRLWDHGVVFLNLAYVPANGWGEAWSLAGTTDLGRMGNLHHELGHVFSLPHWSDDPKYPYRGDMYGIRGYGPHFPHVGPTWAFSLHRRAFIPPTVQANGRVGGAVGRWKKDPMSGGGYGDQEQRYMVRHFSDYSVNQMQRFMERRLLFWDEQRHAYYRWNEQARSYSTKVASDGWNLATDPFAEVISVLVSASAVTPEANFIYPPIGPYKAGLLHRFDANSAADRKRATGFGLTDETCNVCLRVTQGGSTTTYLLEAKLDPATDPLKENSYVTTAINLPAGDGKLTRIDLLHTPNVVSQGVADDAKVLYRWTAK